MNKLNKTSFGSTPPRFTWALQTALAAQKPVGIPRKRLVLIAALIAVLLLACTAVAVNLFTRSPQYDAVHTGRQALMAKYGLTQETLSLFGEEKEDGSGGLTITYRPIMFNHDAMGTYTVIVPKQGEPSVAWSHDDRAQEAASGELSAAVWGQEQLALAIAQHKQQRAQWANNNQDGDTPPTLEEAAARDQAALAAGNQQVVAVMNVVPQEGDMSPEEAIERAKQAVTRKYGVSADILAGLKADLRMLQYRDEPEPQYRMQLFPPENEHNGWRTTDNLFYVSMFSRSGEVVENSWAAAPEIRTLPDGSLQAYKEAVEEFVNEGAFAVQPPEKKAEIGARILAAGFGELIQNRQYVPPQPGDLPMDKALAAAHQAMRDAFGFAEQPLALLSATAGLVEDQGQRAWAVDYTFMHDEQWEYTLAEKVGTYRVLLAADTGAMRKAEWSLKAQRGTEVFTERNWMQAPALDAEMLGWVAPFMEAAAVIPAKYGEPPGMAGYDWSIEDRAANDQIYRDAGFDPRGYPNGLPDAASIAPEAAKEIAKQALFAEFGLTEEIWQQCTVRIFYWVDTPERPVWWCDVYLTTTDGGEDNYGVTIDAHNSEIINIGHMGPGNG